MLARGHTWFVRLVVLKLVVANRRHPHDGWIDLARQFPEFAAQTRQTRGRGGIGSSNGGRRLRIAGDRAAAHQGRQK
jgi:hypothetical protein